MKRMGFGRGVVLAAVCLAALGRAHTVTIALFEQGTMPVADADRPVDLARRFAGASGYAGCLSNVCQEG